MLAPLAPLGRVSGRLKHYPPVELARVERNQSLAVDTLGLYRADTAPLQPAQLNGNAARYVLVNGQWQRLSNQPGKYLPINRVSAGRTLDQPTG